MPSVDPRVVAARPVAPSALKRVLTGLGVDVPRTVEAVSAASLTLARRENGLGALAEELRRIVPDISRQENTESASFNAYFELKRRLLQAFQCRFLLEAIGEPPGRRVTVVDIGDSAGTHMLYLRALARGRFDVETVSVNLDPRAIEKIKARGLKAVLCRAEALEWPDPVDLFTSFEMVEHLHNPALFFRRLAMRSDDSRLLVTVPYLRRSRVGLHHVRSGALKTIHAEDEHIFELSPEDWTLLMRHTGWRVEQSRIYHQYPRRWPVASGFWAAFWRRTDYEGFWGALLKKDRTFSDLYQDWES